MVVDAIRYQELRVLRPSVKAFGEPDLSFSQRCSVRCGRVLFVRRAVADVTVQDNERRTPLRLLEDVDCVLDTLQVVGVTDSQHVPSVGQESRLHIFGKGDPRISLDGDVVVVVDPAEIIEPQVSRQGCCFGADALHQAAVTANRVNVIVEDVEIGPIVTVGQPLLRDRHPHAGGHTLPERPRRCFHS